MTTFKQKTSKPYTLLLISIPIVVLLLFNISLFYYSTLQAQGNLEKVMEDLDSNSQKLNPKGFAMNIIEALYRAKNTSDSVELIIYNPDERISDYVDLTNSFITEESANIIFDKIVKTDEITPIFYDYKLYYAFSMYSELRSLPVKIIYVSKGNFSKEFITIVNAILGAVLAIVTAIALLISRRISINIAKNVEPN